jgi:hypothetical protein
MGMSIYGSNLPHHTETYIWLSRNLHIIAHSPHILMACPGDVDGFLRKARLECLGGFC